VNEWVWSIGGMILTGKRHLPEWQCPPQIWVGLTRHWNSLWGERPTTNPLSHAGSLKLSKRYSAFLTEDTVHPHYIGTGKAARFSWAHMHFLCLYRNTVWHLCSKYALIKHVSYIPQHTVCSLVSLFPSVYPRSSPFHHCSILSRNPVTSAVCNQKMAGRAVKKFSFCWSICCNR